MTFKKIGRQALLVVGIGIFCNFLYFAMMPFASSAISMGGFKENMHVDQQATKRFIDNHYIERGYTYMAQYPRTMGNWTLENSDYSAPPRIMCPSKKIVYIDAHHKESDLESALFALCAPRTETSNKG